MYLGRQVVRRPARTLRPVAGSMLAREHETPWQIAPTGRSSAQNAATFACRSRVAEVLAHPRRVAAGQDQAVELGRLDLPPGERLAERRVLGQLLVEGDRLGLGAELAEDDAVEQLGSQRGAAPPRSVAKTTSWPRSVSSRQGTATSVVSKSLSGNGTRTRTGEGRTLTESTDSLEARMIEKMDDMPAGTIKEHSAWKRFALVTDVEWVAKAMSPRLAIGLVAAFLASSR